MAKKCEHIDILANLSNDSSNNKLITIYKQSDGRCGIRFLMRI